MAIATRLSGQDRRSMILKEAIRLFSEKGFRGVTTRELAASIGVSEPVLYQHFPNKKDLYTAILEASKDEYYVEALERLRALGEGADDEAFFRHLAESMIEWHQQKPELVRLKMFSSMEGHEQMQEFHDKQAKPFLEVIVGYIEKRQREGAFAAVDPLTAAFVFAGAIANYCQSTIVFRSPLCAGIGQVEMVNLSVGLFLNGIRKG
ncbi:MAG: TetR/AcrR family transcriptional regulator [Acidobacteriota bacterium]